MSLPPEPIDDLLRQAVTVVLAEVVSVDPATSPARQAAVGLPIGLAPKLPAATVHLRVERTLKGAAPVDLSVVKPPSTYALAPGIRGPFLLDGQQRILGRHGPDNYSLAAVTQALAQAGR